jgi:hypothetical protein
VSRRPLGFARPVRILPNLQSCQRLVRALALEVHENWLEVPRYLNVDDLRSIRNSPSNKPPNQLYGRPLFADWCCPCLTGHPATWPEHG